MQRSLLPRDLPDRAGPRDRPRLRVVGSRGRRRRRLRRPHARGRAARVFLGDVTGKGIQAAADMAMAKFSFRALARIHPEPGDFLAARRTRSSSRRSASGKFITMLYAAPRPEDAAASPARAPAIRRRGSSRPTEPCTPAGRPASRSASRRTRTTRPSELASSRAPRRPLHRRRHRDADATASCTARRGSTRSSPDNAASRRRRSRTRILADCRAFGGGDLGRRLRPRLPAADGRWLRRRHRDCRGRRGDGQPRRASGSLGRSRRARARLRPRSPPRGSSRRTSARRRSSGRTSSG